MPASKRAQRKAASAKPPSPEAGGDSKPDGIEPEAAKSLIDNILARLGGGLHGSFYETGSRLDDDKRHEQLPHLFEIKDLLERYLKVHETKDATPTHIDNAEEAEKPAKMAGKPGKDMRAYIESIVEQHLDPKIRDHDIKMERLMESMSKTQVATNGKKVKGVGGASAEEDLDSKIEVAKLKSRVKALESKLVEREQEIQQWSAQSGHVSNTTREDIQQLQEHRTNHREDLNGVSNRLIEIDLRLGLADKRYP